MKSSFFKTIGTFLLSSISILLFAGPIETADSTGLPKDDHRTEVLLLGVWHFSNPGLDEYNTEVDDYFNPKRQQEISEVNNRLASFQPNKIFVECQSSRQAYIDSLYQSPDFDPKKLQKNRGVNELYQIGFKLGNLLGHQKLYCVDASGLWIGPAVNKVAAEQYPELTDNLNNKFKKIMVEKDQFLASHTIRESLLDFNTAKSLAENHNYYITFAASIVDNTVEEDFPIFEHEEAEGTKGRLSVSPDRKYIGAELVAEWYRRNIKIYSKILEAVESGDERILIVFGQGHIPIIRQLFIDHPDFKVVEVNTVL
jgi:hypothetical protein